MHTEEIRIFNLASTAINREGVNNWLEDMGGGVEIPDLLTGAEEVIAHGCKRCYRSHKLGLNPNLTQIRNDWTKTLTNAIEQGHGSVLEHAYYTFAIEGVTRVFTAEMNRHRAGVGISEGSMRYISFKDIPYWIPSSIRYTQEEFNRFNDLGGFRAVTISSENMAFWEDMVRRVRSQIIFRNAFEQAEDNYRQLDELWQSYLESKGDVTSKEVFRRKKNITSMKRRIIPMGVCTGGIWTCNIRAIRHIISMRADEPAEEEIFYVWTNIAKYMLEKEKVLFCDFEQTEEGFWRPKNWKV